MGAACDGCRYCKVMAAKRTNVVSLCSHRTQVITAGRFSYTVLWVSTARKSFTCRKRKDYFFVLFVCLFACLFDPGKFVQLRRGLLYGTDDEYCMVCQSGQRINARRRDIVTWSLWAHIACRRSRNRSWPYCLEWTLPCPTAWHWPCFIPPLCTSAWHWPCFIPPPCTTA